MRQQAKHTQLQMGAPGSRRQRAHMLPEISAHLAITVSVTHCMRLANLALPVDVSESNFYNMGQQETPPSLSPSPRLRLVPARQAARAAVLPT